MATDLASLALKVNFEDIEKADEAAKKLAKSWETVGKDSEKSGGAISQSMGGATKSIEGTTKANSGLVAGFGDLKTLLLGLGIGTITTQYVTLSDKFTDMNSRLRIVLESSEEFIDTQQRLFEISDNAYSSVTDTVFLFAKLKPFMDNIGTSAEDALKFTDSIAKSVQLGGASAQEATTAMTQLAQALGSGVLQGDEFRTMMEATPRLMQKLADGMGVPIGALKDLSREGELTAKVVIDAMISQNAAITAEFDQLAITSGKAWTLVKNETIKAIAEIEKELGAAAGWRDILLDLANGISGFTAGLIKEIKDTTDAWVTFTDAISNSDPVATLAGIFGGMGVSLDTMSSHSGILLDIAKWSVVVAGAAGGMKLFGAALAIIVGSIASLGALPAVLFSIGIAALTIIENWEDFEQYWDLLWVGAGTILNSFKGIMETVTAGVIQAKDDIVQGFQEIAENVTDAYQLVIDKWETLSKLIPTNMEETLDLTGEAAVSGIKKLGAVMYNAWGASTIPGFKKETNKDMQEVGSFIIEGLGDGITAGASISKQSLLVVQEDMFKGIESYWEIQSPSKKMMRAGLDIISGQANGLTAGASLLLEAMQKVQDPVIKYIADMAEEMKLQTLELTKGKEAVLAYELGLKGLNDQQIALAISAKTASEQEKALYDSIHSAISNADNVRDVFKNLGTYMKDWLKDKVATFAAQKITAYMDIGGQEGVNSILGWFTSKLGGVAGTISQAVTGIGGSVANLISGASGNITSLAQSVLGMSATTSTVTSGISTLNAGLGATGTAAATTGASLSSMASSAAATAGPIAAVVAGSAVWINTLRSLFASYKTHAKGFELVIENGGILGESVEIFKKKAWSFRSKFKEVMGDLAPEIQNAVTDWYTTLNDTIVEQSGILGVAGADSILDGFSVAATRFLGDDIEGQLEEYMVETTRGAYQHAFDRLGPDLQDLITESVSLQDSSIQEIQATWQRLADSFTTVNEVASKLNLTFTATGEAGVILADQLVQSMGGLDQFRESTNAYFNEYFTETEKQQLALAAVTKDVAEFNVGLGLSGDAVIDTKEELRAYIEQQDLATISGQEAAATAIEVADSLAIFAAEGKPLQEVVDSLPVHLSEAFDTMKADAEAMSIELERQSERQLENARLLGGDLDALAIATNAELIQSWQLGANDVLKVVSDSNEQMVLKVIDAQGNIVSTVTASQEELQTVINGGASEIVNTWGATTGDILTDLTDQGANMTLVMSTETGNMVSALTLGAGDMTQLVEGLGHDIVASTGYTADSIVEITTKSGEVLQGTWLATGDEIIRIVTSNGSVVQGQFQGMSDGIISIIDSTGTTVSGTLANSGNNWVSIVDSTGRTITGTLSNAGSSMVSVMNSAASGIEGAAGSASNSLGRLDGNIDGVGNAASSAGSAMKNAANSMYSAADRAKAAMRNLNGSGGGGGDRTALAVGMDRVPYDGFEATLHEGELVANAELAAELRRMGVTNESTNLDGYLDYRSAPVVAFDRAGVNIVNKDISESNRVLLGDDRTNDATAMILKEIRDELSQANKKNETNLRDQQASAARLASVMIDNNVKLEELADSQDQYRREIKNAVVNK